MKRDTAVQRIRLADLEALRRIGRATDRWAVTDVITYLVRAECKRLGIKPPKPKRR